MSSKALDPQVQIAEFARVVFAHTPSDDVTFEDVIDPVYWANVSNKFKPGCHIEVTASNLTWFAELMVIDCARTWTKVAVLRHVKLTASKKAIKDADLDKEVKGYDINFAGTGKKYRVIRKSDNTELKDGFPTEDAAVEFVKNHIKALSL